jgi:hypothetical protein
LTLTLPGHSAPSASIQVTVTDGNLVGQEIQTGFQVFIPALQR